jgi:hypothetical protein
MSERINKQNITSGYHAIKNGSQYDRYFSKPETVDRVIIEDGEVDETVDLMKRVVWKYIDDTKRIAQFLKANTLNKTCENIWTFLHDHIQYRLDKKGVEQLRRPSRSWAERTEGIDCDCFSIFVSSILTNLEIPHKFRITKYNTNQFQHVYVIVPNGAKHITIDCVLSEFDIEKDYSQNKDFTMNMNGINIAVLSGIASDDLLELVSGLEGIGELSTTTENERALYEHLVKTRNLITANPNRIRNVDQYEPFLKMLNYAILHWNTPNRQAALEYLSRNEDQLNRLSGFDGSEDAEMDGLDELYGDDDELNGKKAPKKAAKKGFFKKVGAAVKKGAKAAVKAVVRYNPVTIAARNGFLLAMKINFKKMAAKLKWGYATKEQASAKGVSATEWEKSKNALTTVEKLFADKLQGKRDALKNAILKGKAGGLSGMDDDDGLGVLPAAALAAAIPVIGMALKILVDSGIMDKKEAENIEAEVNAKAGEANSSASESDMNNTSNGTEADGTGADDKTGGGIMGFVKKQPLVVIGGAALGIWGLTKLLVGKKKSNGMAGTPAKRTYKKRKKKTNTSKKTLKSITLK